MQRVETISHIYVHPGSSPLFLLVFWSQSFNGAKNFSIGLTDISLMFPVSFCNASGHGWLEPNLSISANSFPASFEPDMSHLSKGVPGSATLQSASKNWN